MYFFIWTIVFLSIIIIIIFILFLKNNKNKLETFVELLPEEVNKIREEHGMEKCSILYTNDPEVQEDNYFTMVQYIDGLRLKKWKPHKDDPNFSKVKNNKEYCYIYNDKNNNTQDYMLHSLNSTESKCSKNNVLFSSPLITNVFTSEYFDKTHRIPIRKCVFEIDKEKARNPFEVNTFWSSWTKHNCEMLSFQLREEYDRVKQIYDNLNNILSGLQDTFQQLKSTYNIKENTLSSCELARQVLNGEIQNTDEAYQLYVRRVTTQQEILNQLKTQIEYTLNLVQNLENDVSNKYDAYKEQESSFKECVQSKKTCQQEKTHILTIWEELKRKNQELTQTIVNIQGKIDKKTEEYLLRQEKYNTCKTNLENMEKLLEEKTELFNNYSSSNDTCQTDLAELYQSYDNYQKDYKSSSNVYNSCIYQKSVLQEDLSNCREDVHQCVNVIENDDVDRDDNYNPENYSLNISDLNFDNLEPRFNSIQDEINEMQTAIVNFQNDYDECVKNNTDVLATIDTLKNRKNILEDDAKELRAKQRNMSSDSYKTVANNARDTINNTREKFMRIQDQQSEQSIKNKLDMDNIELEAQYEKAITEKNNLESEIRFLSSRERTCKDDCDIDIAQCLIHKGNREICKDTSEMKKVTVDATFSIYDQEDKKVKTVHFTKPDKSEKTQLTGSTDLNYFVFETNNPTAVFSYVAYVGDDYRPCVDSKYQMDKGKNYKIGLIEKGTTYRKIMLYRGTTCVHFFSSDEGKNWR